MLRQEKKKDSLLNWGSFEPFNFSSFVDNVFGENNEKLKGKTLSEIRDILKSCLFFVPTEEEIKIVIRSLPPMLVVQDYSYALIMSEAFGFNIEEGKMTFETSDDLDLVTKESVRLSVLKVAILKILSKKTDFGSDATVLYS